MSCWTYRTDDKLAGEPLMQSTDAEIILAHLREVDKQRHHRRAQTGLEKKVQLLKHYQQQRFKLSYADLLASPRYAPAAEFFLVHLYGPGDFSTRDAQFARVIPAVVKLFPKEVIATVRKLAELHALSEVLDTHMAEHLDCLAGTAAEAYVRAWQATASSEKRARQIELTIAVGSDLERLTRKPLLRQALRMMRSPAVAAGLSELQAFLETGFDTFKAMKGAAHFLTTVETRETELAALLFGAGRSPESARVHAAGVSRQEMLPDCFEMENDGSRS